MRKMVLVSALLAFAVISAGCAEVSDESASESAAQTTSADEAEPVVEPDTFIDEFGNVYDEKPTVHVRDVKESSDFEYVIEDGRTKITKYIGNEQYVAIPDSIEGVPVTEISYYAFEANYDVVSVQIPESVTLIGEDAFMDCASLAEVNIPEAVTGIDRGAFVACASLTEVTVPQNVAYVREEAFTACEGLTTLRIMNPDLKYENWGLEELPNLTIYAPEGSEVMRWAQEKGFNCAAL
ncbi:MAG: leucine-rich repeat domain-containing protein [Ruminococcus sp.]|nr:leucine-rich repeat domain-containing protein [Ruminococcus sp.]